MRRNYLASAASAHWRLISQSCAYLKVVCSLQTDEKQLAFAMLLTTKKTSKKPHCSTAQAFKAAVCKPFGLGVECFQAVCVCSSVKPNVTKRPFFSFFLVCVGLCVSVAACSV